MRSWVAFVHCPDRGDNWQAWRSRGLGWRGTRTGRCSELAHFYEHVLGLRLVHREADFWVFELPDGRHAEIFGSSYPGKEHSVVGFAVRDLPAAVDELRRAGVKLLGGARTDVAALPGT